MIRKALHNILARIRGEVVIDNLVKRGMSVGKNFHCMNSVWMDPGHCWLIKIGDDVTIAPRVTILAHDASPQAWRKVTKIGAVTIGSRVFIGAGSLILPGVNIGNDVIIAAGSVVTSSIPDKSVSGGNPAKFIMSLEEYLSKIDKITDHFNSPDDYFPEITNNRRSEQQRVLTKNRFALLGKKS